MTLRQLLLPIALLSAGVATGTGSATAKEQHKTWSSDEILASPLLEPQPYDCSRTHPVLAVPNFGNGLVADYILEVSAGEQNTISQIDASNRFGYDFGMGVRVAKLTPPKTFPSGGGLITVQDNVVLTSIDDLLERYFRVCQLAREPGLLLRSITYRPASLRQRAEAPARTNWYYLPNLPIPPLSIEVMPGESDFLPPPVVGGDYRFATSFDPLPKNSSLVPMQKNRRWQLDPSKVAIGTGVRLAALFFGHTELRSMKPLIDGGFDVLTIEEGGRIETLIIDRHVSVSADELATRAKLALRYQSFETSLRLTRLDIYPAVLGGIDALRTDQSIGLKYQVAQLRGLELADEYTQLMSFLPQGEYAEPLLKAEWSKFTGSTAGSGYDAIFDAPGSIFGKLETISCEPDDTVFYCKVGVTFTAAGRPKYAERALYFKRFKRESGLLELEAAEPRAPAYDPLRMTAPPAEPTTAAGADAVPTIAEVQQLVAVGWTHTPASIFAGNPQDLEVDSFEKKFAGYGDLNATFVEVHDLACSQRESIFTCTIGVIYTSNGVPRYRQDTYHQFQRVRDADGTWNLKVYLPFDIIVADAKRAPQR